MTKTSPDETPTLDLENATAQAPLAGEAKPAKTRQVATRMVKQEVAASGAPKSDSMAMLEMIDRAARDPAVDIGKMKELLIMRKEFMAEQAEQAFNDSMNLAQMEMRAVSADASNPSTKSRYASFAALDRAIRPIYTKHGFGLSFNTEETSSNEIVRVVCYVTCKGHNRKYQADMPADGKGARGGDVMTKTHAAGSAMSYGQRYILKMVFNIAVESDDDGNAAGKVVRKGIVTDIAIDEPLINFDKEDFLVQRCQEVKCPMPKFLGHLGVEKLADLPVRFFDAAVHALDEYKRNADERAKQKAK